MNNIPIFLSVVLVINNQEKYIQSFLNSVKMAINGLVTDWEIIVVDNASHDDSIIVLKDLLNQNDYPNTQVFTLTHMVERDVAYWAGLENSLGDFVVLFDPIEEDLGFLPEMLRKAISGFDVVFAKNTIEPRRNFTYTIIYGLFNKLFKIFSGINLAIDAPYYRILSRNVVNFILRFQQPALTYRHLPATGGFSKIKLTYKFKSPFSQKKNLLKGVDRGMRLLVSTTKAPMRLVTTLSLFGALSNLLYSFYVLGIWIFKDDVAPGWVSMSLQQSGMFFLISLVLLVLGEYILNMASLSNEGPLYHIGQEIKSQKIIRSKDLNVEEIIH